MKKHLLLLLSLIVIALAGCKSSKQTAQTQEETATTWQNMSVPVTMAISQPMTLTLNGTLTMVRGEYALVSFRTFGIEVATACITPDQLDMVMKAPSKMWISEPLGDRLSSRGVDFTKLQDLFADNTATTMATSGLSFTSNNGVNTIAVSTTAKGVNLTASLTYNLNDAKWNVASPATFSTPGSDYRKLDLQNAAKSLGQ